jgi:hypothetical protein
MNMQDRHWLYQAYLALSVRGDLTERKGRELLKRTFPNAAYLLDDVIAAKGDVSKIKPEKLDLHYDELAEEFGQMEGQAMNTQIRQQMARQPITKTEDVNKIIRDSRSERDRRIDDLFDSVNGKPVAEKPTGTDHPVNQAIRQRIGVARTTG